MKTIICLFIIIFSGTQALAQKEKWKLTESNTNEFGLGVFYYSNGSDSLVIGIIPKDSVSRKASDMRKVLEFQIKYLQVGTNLDKKNLSEEIEIEKIKYYLYCGCNPGLSKLDLYYAVADLSDGGQKIVSLSTKSNSCSKMKDFIKLVKNLPEN